MARSRFVSWGDSDVLRAALERTGGLRVLRQIADGSLPPPPIAALLDVELSRAERGQVEAFAYLSEAHGGFADGVDTALIAAVLEFAVESVMATYADPGTDVRVTRFAVEHLAPVPAGGGPLRCEATVTAAADGHLEATATATALRANSAAATARACAELRARGAQTRA